MDKIFTTEVDRLLREDKSKLDSLLMHSNTYAVKSYVTFLNELDSAAKMDLVSWFDHSGVNESLNLWAKVVNQISRDRRSYSSDKTLLVFDANLEIVRRYFMNGLCAFIHDYFIYDKEHGYYYDNNKKVAVKRVPGTDIWSALMVASGSDTENKNLRTDIYNKESFVFPNWLANGGTAKDIGLCLMYFLKDCAALWKGIMLP